MDVPKFTSFKPKLRRPASEARPSAHKGKLGATDEASSKLGTIDLNCSSDAHEHHTNNPLVSVLQDEVTQDHRHLDSLEKATDLFIVDYRGDSKNLQFGSLHKYDVPKYSLGPNNGVIGLPREQFIDEKQSTGKHVVLRGPKKRKLCPARDLANAGLKIASAAVHVIPTKATVGCSHQTHDYIELNESGWQYGKAVHLDTPPDHIPSHEPDILSSGDSPKGYELNSQSTEVDASVQNAQRENARLYSAAINHSTEPQYWLKLIDHQARIIHASASQPTLTKTELNSLSKLRLSVYDKALTYIKNGHHHEKLMIARQKESTRLLETREAENVWRNLLSSYPDDIEVWTGYLDFKQFQQKDFNYQRCMEIYIKRLSAWRNSRGAEVGLHCEAQVYNFVRLTALTRDAGFSESALAMWQIVLEYVFLQHHNRRSSVSPELLRDFWDSDAPRIGEQQSKGCGHFFANGKHTERSTDTVGPFEVEDIGNTTTNFGQMVAKEKAACERLRLPAVEKDDHQENDPYRYVVYDDIADITSCLWNSIPKRQLLDGFLCFMQLPPIVLNHSVQLPWQGDPCLWTISAQDDIAEPEKTTSPYKRFRRTSIALFDSTFQTFEPRVKSLRKHDPATLLFIDRALESMVFSGELDEIDAEYWLAFKLSAFPEDSHKVSKQLIKEMPLSVRLYNACALIRAQVMSLEKANEIWFMALRNGSDFVPRTRDEENLLLHSCIMKHLISGYETAALSILLSVANGTTDFNNTWNLTPSLRLKATKFFDEKSLAASSDETRPMCAELSAWVTYLLEGFSVQSALEVLDEYTRRQYFYDRAGQLEWLHQSKAFLVKLHLQRKRPYRPAFLQAHIGHSVELFSENSLILEVYDMIESRLHGSHLRAALNSSLSRPGSEIELAGWMNRVERELRRYSGIMVTSTADSVRRTFERALLDIESKVTHCPMLWQMWFSFERERVKLLQSTVGAYPGTDLYFHTKRVYYHGLQLIPWHKLWLLTGVDYFTKEQVLDQDELKRLWDLMWDRELRIV